MTSAPPLLFHMEKMLALLKKVLPPLTLAFSLFFVYLRTMAPGLSWANNGSDGGDLITAAATGGVAHPTGYPLYLLVARLFQFLPIGSLAFRTNLMSAIFTALAAVLIYEIVRQARLPSGSKPGWPAGMLSGYAFGLAPLVWSQAVITEVYALQAFLTALILYLYLRPSVPSPSIQKRLDYCRGLALGLAMGNHVTTVLLVPAALHLGSIDRDVGPGSGPDSRRSWSANLRLDRGALLRQVAMFAAGLAIYLILPLRALADPPVNWGNAVTPARLWWLVSGQLYQSYYLQFSPVESWGRIQSAAALFIQQFGLPGIVLGLVGLIVLGAGSRLYILTTWTAVVFTAFAVFYGSADSYVYLIPMVLSFSIWAGLGLSGLTQQSTPRSGRTGFVLGLLVIGYFAARSLTLIGQVDASQDVRAESFGREVFSAAPQNAIVFAKGDQAVFSLWYFHFAVGERPDLTVVATDLLHFDWYTETLGSGYPSLKISSPFPWPETIVYDNPSRPVCYVQYTDEAMIDCK